MALAVRRRLRQAPLAEVRVEQGGELRLYSAVSTQRGDGGGEFPNSVEGFKGKTME